MGVRHTLRTDGTDSADELVVDNMPLVGHLVSEMLGKLPSHVSRDELASAGLAALVQAARSFDPAVGVSFARFAASRIRGAIVDELRSSDWATRSVRASARRRQVAEDALVARLGRRPTTQEISAFLGTSEADVVAGEHDVQRAAVLSLHAPIEVGTLSDAVEDRALRPDERLLHRERLGYLRDAIANLPERLRTVVLRYFVEEHPMSRIAADLGVTESRVSQLRAEAVSLLRHAMNAHLAPELVVPLRQPGGVLARRREAYVAAVAAHSDYRARLATLPADEVAGDTA
jgi:RNA polymerase sigma factor for flagellar operon FliA